MYRGIPGAHVLQRGRMFAQRAVGYPAQMQGRQIRVLVQLASYGHVAGMVHHVGVLPHQRRRVHADVVLAEQRLAVLINDTSVILAAITEDVTARLPQNIRQRHCRRRRRRDFVVFFLAKHDIR